MFITYSKKIFLISIVTILILSSFTSSINADTIIPFSARVISDKNIIAPKKIVLVKITPKLQDPNKFLSALDSLFLDGLGQNQSLFSYVVLDNSIYKIRDLDISYDKTNTGSIVYIAYTNNVPLTFLSNLHSIFNINSIMNGSLVFNKNNYSVNETTSLNLNDLPKAKIDVSLKYKSSQYNVNPDPGSLNKVIVNFTNNSFYPIFKSDPSLIIVVALDDNNQEHSSEMFLNEQWYTVSRAGQVDQTRISYTEDGTISFTAVVQALPGQQKQKFSLAKTNGELIPNTTFDTLFQVPDKKQKVVQVIENTYGFTNMHDEPKVGSRIIGFKYKGTNMLVVQDNVGGWTKVRFDGTKEGWTPTGALKKVNF